MSEFCVGDLASHSLAQCFCIAGSRNDNKKFLATPATDQILFADHGVKDAGCFGQNIITHSVPPAVVHLLEVIDIDQQDGKFTMNPLRSGKLLLEEGLRCAPVWDVGQDVNSSHLQHVISQALADHEDETH